MSEHHYSPDVRKMNYDYLKNCDISELCWFLETALNLLKHKAMKIEMDGKQREGVFAGLE